MGLKSESLPDLSRWYRLDLWHKFQQLSKSQKNGVRIPSRPIYSILCAFFWKPWQGILSVHSDLATQKCNQCLHKTSQRSQLFHFAPNLFYAKAFKTHKSTVPKIPPTFDRLSQFCFRSELSLVHWLLSMKVGANAQFFQVCCLGEDIGPQLWGNLVTRPKQSGLTCGKAGKSKETDWTWLDGWTGHFNSGLEVNFAGQVAFWSVKSDC